MYIQGTTSPDVSVAVKGRTETAGQFMRFYGKTLKDNNPCKYCKQPPGGGYVGIS